MGAVRMLFGTELRRRWRSWLILVGLIAVVAGLVLAATAAGRRTATAFPRFVASHGYDVYIYNQKPVSGLSRLPGVSSVTSIANPASGRLATAREQGRPRGGGDGHPGGGRGRGTWPR